MERLYNCIPVVKVGITIRLSDVSYIHGSVHSDSNLISVQ